MDIPEKKMKQLLLFPCKKYFGFAVSPEEFSFLLDIENYSIRSSFFRGMGWRREWNLVFLPARSAFYQLFGKTIAENHEFMARLL